MKISGVTVRELKMLNQYSKFLKKTIYDYKSSKSICGYMVSVAGPILAQSASFMMQPSQIDAVIKKLKDPNVIVPELEKCMEIIQGQRQQYVRNHFGDFRTKKDRDRYITDWVAKYEISDLMQIIAPHVENLFFIRYVGFEFPHLVRELQHEEKKRIKEEEVFKGNRFIIESFCGGRKLQTLEEWLVEGRVKMLNEYDKPLVFIGDLLGHYVTFLACKVLKEDGTLEDTVFLINSVYENHISRHETIFALCQLVFPGCFVR